MQPGEHRQTPAPSLEQLLARALAQVNAQRPDLAKDLCLRWLAQHPGEPAVHQLMAVLCLREGDVPRARHHIEASLAQRPHHLPSLMTAGDVARAAKDWTAAAAHYGQAHRLTPRHRDAAFGLGVAQHQLGQLASARESLSAATALDPAHVESRYALAVVLQDLRDLDGAAAALKEVLRLAPQLVEAEVNLGIVLQDSGRLDEAMQAYGRAFRLREETFGRIAHALAAASRGRLWLDLDELRDTLRKAGA